MDELIQEVFHRFQVDRKSWSRTAATLHSVIAIVSHTPSADFVPSVIPGAGTCRIEGWLLKAMRLRDDTLSCEWVRRWFMLKDGCLLYFKDVKQAVLLGALPLAQTRCAYFPTCGDHVRSFPAL